MWDGYRGYSSQAKNATGAHDRELTEASKAAAGTVGLRFLDHLISGDDPLFSFKANGLL